MKTRYIIGVAILFALAASVALSFGHKARPPVIITKLSRQIKPTSFFCAAFDTTHVLVNPADCNTNNGSVVGLQGTGTGTLTYSWYNSIGAKISDQADLTNVTTGTYRVTLADESKCATVSLTYFVKENNPVSIDYTTGTITSPTCNAVNGSITGIVVRNATKFQWIDGTNTPIPGATTKDLFNVGPGTYILNATNDKGCLAQARYTVDAGSYAPKLTSYHYVDSDCGNSGEFYATFDMKAGEMGYAYSIEEVNTHKTYRDGILNYNPLDSTRIIIHPPTKKDALNVGIPGGTYILSTIGANNCITQLVKFTINVPEYKIDTSQMLIKTNVCGVNTGVILGLNTIGGPAPLGRLEDPDPTHGWFWFNSSGLQLSFKGNYLGSQPSGYYTVYAINHEGCQSNTLKLFLPDSISTASTPQLNDIKICLPGTVGLDVLNKDPKAHYRLYDSTRQTVIDTSTAGYFSRKVDVTTTFYVQSINGICPSPLGKVTVTVVNPGVTIPNAFTPNNDGINDHWDVTGLEHYPGTEVSVFNRNGQRVYHSINYSSPFDGNYNGKPLPVGVYYYIVDTKKPDCRAGVSGSLTIIR